MADQSCGLSEFEDREILEHLALPNLANSGGLQTRRFGKAINLEKMLMGRILKQILRRLKWRSLRVILLAGSLCYLVSIFLFHARLDHDFSSSDTLYWRKPFFDPFEIRKIRPCSWKGPKSSQVSIQQSLKKMSSPIRGSTDMCIQGHTHEPDIQMVEEWDQISVGYPQLVVSVTGWVDTIKVDSWTMRPLHVIIVPFSHQDPGWKSTYDSCYASFAKPTLSQVVIQLTNNPKLRFVWSEIVFLERWWNEASAQQKIDMKSLVQSGRFEILGGGWVMPDEASTHYAATLDQLIEGHQWIHEYLGITVNNSWAVDPFGHSPTIAYMNRKAGIQNMLIQRTHFAIKRHFAKKKYLEFFWKQHWGTAGQAIFCHMMPFLLYSVPHSCGPDRHVCCKFDFDRAMCFKGKEKTGPLTVTDENIETLARALWDQLRKKSELYRSDVLLMPHGDDFRYNAASEWKKQFDNLNKLIEYINSNKDMQMMIEYGTLSDYFTKVHQSITGPDSQQYPTLTGDFFPYSDRADQYWSGHYTSRPFYKHMARNVQSKLRSVEILFTMAQARKLLPLSNVTVLYNELTTTRRALALFQHHDAITGTSKKEVVMDYANKLYSAMINLQLIQRSLVEMTVSKFYFKTQYIQPTEVWFNVNELPIPEIIDVQKTRVLVVNNPLFHSRNTVVSVLVNSMYIQVTHDGKPVRIQISPVFENNSLVLENQYMLSFEVCLAPADMKVYQLKLIQSLEQSNLATIALFKRPTDSNWFRNFGPFKVTFSDAKEFTIKSNNISATVSACDGTLKFVHQDGYSYKSDVHFVRYMTGTSYNPLKDKSGAYIFLPDRTAEEQDTDAISVFKISGELFSQVKSVYKDITHHIRVFNITGPEGTGIQLENLVNIGNADWNNIELAMRLETDIISPEHHFCTDSNGFQMQSRKTRLKLNIQGNFYPITTSVFIEDDTTRLTMVTTEAHGVASLASGTLDIMLDRRLMQDDWRGLNEGVTDNQLTKSSFFIVFENKHGNMNYISKGACYPSPMGAMLPWLHNNPPDVFFTQTLPTSATSVASLPIMPVRLPCGYHVVNLRMLRVVKEDSLKECLLILHRTATDCTFMARHQTCDMDAVKFSSLLSFMNIVSVTETTITGVKDIQNLSPDDYIDIPLMEIKTYKIAFR